MAAQDKVTFKQDLTEPVKIRHYEGVVFTGDDCGNLIKVALFDGGAPYSGGGTVSATAVLADGTTFPLTHGSITGNMVSVPLEAGALVVSGLMGLYVKISGGGIICTVLNAIFTVQVTDTGRVPAATVTTVNELVQEIKDAQDSFPADLTNLLAAVAPTFSTSTAYSAGAYVWQGGKLYRFTAAHPAGTWTGTDAVTVALGDDVADLKSAFGKVATVDEVISINVLNPETATRGGYLNGSGTVISPTDTAYGYTDYISVKKDDVVRFYRRSQLDSFPGCMYYSDGTVANIVSAPNYTQASANGSPSSFTVPDGVTSIRINIRWGYLDEYMITINNDYPSSYIGYQTQTKINDDVKIPVDGIDGLSVLNGKTIMFCGDSITYGAHADTDSAGNRKNFGYYIQQKTGCNSKYNAISGSTMMNVAGKSPFSVDRYTQLGNNLDYIVLAFVTNDSASDNSLIGQYGDSTNGTFWGAWKVVLDYLITNYPTSKIGIIGFWRGNQKYQWTDALREIANKYRIPFLDFMLDPNIPLVGGTDFRSYYPNAPFVVDYNTLDRRQSTFLADSVHPNDNGYQYLATIIQSYLEKL